MIDALRRGWERWVAFWAVQEHPRALAVVRICLGLVILYDFVQIWVLDLVPLLFAPGHVGGLSPIDATNASPWFYDLFPRTVASGRLLHAIITVSAFAFTVGAFTRTAALVLLLSWAQHAQILPAADRGIDTLCRDVLWIFLFADAGATWSIDAVRRTGSWFGDGTDIGAWARRLVVLQLVAMYFLAGVQKGGIHWYPMGYFASLYFILQDPAIAQFDFGFLANQPFFFTTQVGTAVTIVFQDTYPLVLLWAHYRNTPDQPGRLRAFANRWRLEWWWIGTGALFHVLLAATTELGIFPWAMLALYPAWLRPVDVANLQQWLADRTGLPVAPSSSA
ncbi:MAG: HTTM domain-containing protein [Myxococcota bacterium]